MHELRAWQGCFFNPFYQTFGKLTQHYRGQARSDGREDFPVSFMFSRTPPFTSFITIFNSTTAHRLVTLRRMQDAGLRNRVQRDPRDRFQRACQAQDKFAVQVLCEFQLSSVLENKAPLADEPPTSYEPNTKVG